MGCVLGPTMANFYMGHLEKVVFEKHCNLRPKQYNRYIDDTFGSFRNREHLLELKEKFEENSCLKFTYETEKDNNINFLDVTIVRN
jgi:hypothetical protein